LLGVCGVIVTDIEPVAPPLFEMTPVVVFPVAVFNVAVAPPKVAEAE
jgi:hypothetical protein